jgi:hypothetical protein
MFNSLYSTITSLLTSRHAFSGGITKSMLKRHLNQLQSQHMMLIGVLEPLVLEAGAGIASLVEAKKSSYPIYINLIKQLSPEVRRLETAKALSAVLAANVRFVKVLEELEADVDDLYNLERINMLNMRVSHLVVQSAIYQSKTLTKYTKYLFSYISNTMSAGTTPGYRIKYMQDQVELMGSIVNTLNSKTGICNYRSIINLIRKNAADVTLVDKDANPQVDMIKNGLNLGSEGSDVIAKGIMGLPTFRSLGELINLMTNDIVKWLHQEETWMRSHVAMINAKMEGLDVRSDEYKQLEKITQRYESMIDLAERTRSKLD